MSPFTESPTLELLPAVDVADGQAVRLVQGEAGSETSYGDPLDAALAWQEAGAEWVHLVDLDAAFGRGSNKDLLERVVRNLVECAGGSVLSEPGLWTIRVPAEPPAMRASALAD